MGLILSWEDSLEEEMATHPSGLAWEIPWTDFNRGRKPNILLKQKPFIISYLKTRPLGKKKKLFVL